MVARAKGDRADGTYDKGGPAQWGEASKTGKKRHIGASG